MTTGKGFRTAFIALTQYEQQFVMTQILPLEGTGALSLWLVLKND